MGGMVALVGLALWWFTYKKKNQKLSSISLPNGTTVSVLRDSLNYKLAAYLASGSRDAPKTFDFDQVSFRPSSTDLRRGSVENLRVLATILKAYPDVEIHLMDHSESPVRLHTNQKHPVTNQKPSVDRANAAKAVLLASGIDPQRISTTGFGWSRPVETDQTEPDHAKNRWLDLTVMANKEMVQSRPTA